MKNGIILAGGTGSRLYPLTHVVNKHLLGVDGKFIIDYPINTLKQMGVENLTVVLGGNHFSQVVDHIKDGSSFGMSVNYVYQGAAKGIAQAINLCQRYVADQQQFAVILGDNIFSPPIEWNTDHNFGAQIVLYSHPELHRFGVATLDKITQEIVVLQEKPQVFTPQWDHYAITGCYLFDQNYWKYFTKIFPSARGELEVVDIIDQYRIDRNLSPIWISEYEYWSDAGTHESIAKANQYFYNYPQR